DGASSGGVSVVVDAESGGELRSRGPRVDHVVKQSDLRTRLRILDTARRTPGFRSEIEYTPVDIP
ncbi:MAG: hypothetical protein WBQ30_07355, partial [Thermoanaerobaculia bacterium]